MEQIILDTQLIADSVLGGLLLGVCLISISFVKDILVRG